MTVRLLWMATVLCWFQLPCLACASEERQTNVEPTSDSAALVAQEEIDYLARRQAAVRVILDKAYEEYRLAVSEEEIADVVSREMVALFGKPTFTQADADAANRRMNALKRLMTIWRSDPQQAESTWKAEFADVVSDKEWERAKEICSTTAGYASLMKSPPITVEAQYRGLEQQAREELLRTKLEAALKSNKTIREGENISGWLGRQPEIMKLTDEYRQRILSRPRQTTAPTTLSTTSTITVSPPSGR